MARSSEEARFMNEQHISAYLKLFATTVFSVVFIVCSINLLIDPYRLFSLFERAGVNRIKPYAYNEEGLSKAILAGKFQAKAIILGNSRAQVGLDPTHPRWPVTPVMNLAVPGAGIDSSLAYLRQATAASRPEIVVLGVDFADFLSPAEKLTTSGPEKPEQKDSSQYQNYAFSTYPDGSVNPYYQTTLLKRLIVKVASLDALWHSLGTLYYQHQAYSKDVTEQGFNPMRDYIPIVKSEGYNSVFRQRDYENLRRYAKSSKQVFEPNHHWPHEFDVFKQIAEFCHAQHIQLIVIIYPYHAHLLETINLTGLWPVFESWKRGLIEILAKINDQSIQLWDFSGYHSYATEAVPEPRDEIGIVKWYWEAGHFKKELGDLMLERIFVTDRNGGVFSGDFGILLTKDNVDAKLAEANSMRARYMSGHGRDIANLQSMMAN
jgi:hypothetical protein